MPEVTYDPKRFGINLHSILKTLEITQVDFAERAQMTPAAVSQIINGEREPSLQTVCKILGALPVTFERLLR